jgi:hypothetical protein
MRSTAIAPGWRCVPLQIGWGWVSRRDFRLCFQVTSIAKMQGRADGTERLMASTRFPVLLKSNPSDCGEAIRVVFMRIVRTGWRGVAAFSESTPCSVIQHRSSTTMSSRACAADDSGARAMYRATGRAAYGPCSKMERS